MSSFYGCWGGPGGGGPNPPAVGIKTIFINENGELIFTLTDGSSQNVGVVVGRNGVTFIPHIENNVLYWTNDGGLKNPTPISLDGNDETVWTEIQEALEELQWGNVDKNTAPVGDSDYTWFTF